MAVILDLASRMVVGWAMQSTLAQSLTHAALQMAVVRRRPLPGVVHHSDRGVQYAAAEYRACLGMHGMTPSMSRKGDCYDNAVVESFFATLEWELIANADSHTRAEARTAIFEYIEVWSQSAAAAFLIGLCQSRCVRSAVRRFNTSSINRMSIEAGEDQSSRCWVASTMRIGASPDRAWKNSDRSGW